MANIINNLPAGSGVEYIEGRTREYKEPTIVCRVNGNLTEFNGTVKISNPTDYGESEGFFLAIRDCQVQSQDDIGNSLTATIVKNIEYHLRISPYRSDTHIGNFQIQPITSVSTSSSYTTGNDIFTGTNSWQSNVKYATYNGDTGTAFTII